MRFFKIEIDDQVFSFTNIHVYLGLAEKVVCGGRELLTGNREQF
jgi:hypothetical protein